MNKGITVSLRRNYCAVLCGILLGTAAFSGTAAPLAHAAETESAGSADPVTALNEELLSLNISSREDAAALVPLSVRYEALTAEQKAQLSDEAKVALDSAKLTAASCNHTDQGVTVSADLPWYTQLKVTVLDTAGETAEDGSTIIVPYEITLWDLYTDSVYDLEGQTVTVGVPVPDVQVEGDLKVIHYLHDGSTETLYPTLDGGMLYFETASFSNFSLAGDVIIGIGPGTPSTETQATETEDTEARQTETTAQTKAQTPDTAAAAAAGTSAAQVKADPALTGDETQVLPALLACGAAAVVAAAALVSGRKKNKEQ